MSKRTTFKKKGGEIVPTDKANPTEKVVPKDKDLFVFPTKYISVELNRDPQYEEVGIVHITTSRAVNLIRDVGTGLANLFGNSGFDNTIYDKARNEALTKLAEQIDTTNQKVSSLRMELTTAETSSLFFIHLYGTLLQKKMVKMM
jgi:uncharacterized protein YbjQ (UPF0145 family)